jgi:hypothetical protein
MQSECTLDVWANITKRAIADALEGDRSARQWLSQYVIGPPVKRVMAQVEQSTSSSGDIDHQVIQVLAILQTIIQSDSDDQGDTPIDGDIIDGECSTE